MQIIIFKESGKTEIFNSVNQNVDRTLYYGTEISVDSYGNQFEIDLNCNCYGEPIPFSRNELIDYLNVCKYFDCVHVMYLRDTYNYKEH